MTPAIINWMRPDVNWVPFIKTAETILGYNPIRAAEQSTRPLSQAAKLIAVIAAFKDRDATDWLEALRNAGPILRHMQYGFLVAADSDVMMEISQVLDVTTAPTVNNAIGAIVTGNLLDFYLAIKQYSTPNTLYGVRYIFSWLLVFFEREGLGELWSDQVKIVLADRTLKLEQK